MSKFTEQLKSMKDGIEGLVLKFNEMLVPPAPIVAPVGLTDHTLADGTILSIDKVEVNGKATIAGAPADGDFELPDGTKIKVVGGVITEVVMKEQEAPISEAMFSEYKKEMEAKFSAMSKLVGEVLEVSKQQFSLIEEISKEPIAKPLDKVKLDFKDIPFEQLTAYQRRQLVKQEA